MADIPQSTPPRDSSTTSGTESDASAVLIGSVAAVGFVAIAAAALLLLARWRRRTRSRSGSWEVDTAPSREIPGSEVPVSLCVTAVNLAFTDDILFDTEATATATGIWKGAE
jgi:hypothetical protein